MSILYNISRSEFVLKAKNNSACYHTVHELGNIGKSLVEHIPSSDNIIEHMTKVWSEKETFR